VRVTSGGQPRETIETRDPLVTHLPLAVFGVDADGLIVQANAAAVELAGEPEELLSGRALWDALPWALESGLRRALSAPEGVVDVDAAPDDAVDVDARGLVRVIPAAAGDAAAAWCVVADSAAATAWRRRMAGVQALAAALTAAATRADITDVVVRRGRELVGAESAAAALRSSDGTGLVMAAMAGFESRIEREWSRVELDPPTPMSDAFTSGMPVFLESAEDRVRDYPHLPHPSGRAIGAVPVKGRGDAFGAVAFRFAGARRLSADDRALMLMIGEQYGQALDRARLFEAAEAERQRLEALMHQLPVGVAIAEASTGHIVAVNERANSIWRVPPSRTPVTDLGGVVGFHPDGRRYADWEWPIARSLATGEIVESEEVEAQFGDGTRGWVTISARPVLAGDGQVLGAVTTLVDVTERRRREREAQFIAETADLLAASLDPEETLRRLAELVVPRLADWCGVYVREGRRVRPVAVAHADPRKVELAWNFTRRYPTDADAPGGVAEVMRTGGSILTPNLTREMVAAVAPDDDFTRIVYDELGVRSIVTVPLQARGELFGALTLVMAESGRVIDEHDRGFAEDFATHAALAVANARLYAAQYDLAETLQASLLPIKLPDIPGLEVATRFRPAGRGTEVGGDFFDLWQIGDEGAFGVAVGDVCGKGAAAAALTALARHTVRTASIWLPEHGPDDVLFALNDAIIKRAGRGRFCTVAHGFGRPVAEGFEVAVACGGHPLPFVARAGGAVEQPGTPGTLLGVYEDIESPVHLTLLEPGDTLIMWTDGVSERRGGGELFGEDRLRDIIAANAARPPGVMADAIEAAVLGFAETDPQDDIALLVARVHPR
jgi:serine phosphatase RsbU (regulator of sigma subunit)/PAS domain-containing protein